MDKDIYRTNSLPLAAYLNTMSDKVEFVGVEKDNPKSIFFIYKPQSEAQKMADEYFSGKSRVDPLELFKNYRNLKDLIFEAKRNVGIEIN